MATYVFPQVLVFQDFAASPVAAVNPLRAHISGGHAQLIRYAEPDEQALGLLGYYDNLIETSYSWPHRPAGGIVDQGYVKLWVKNALLQYFDDGSTITKTAGYNNRIRSSSVNFAENTDTYPRAAALLDRDVRPGDIAKVRGTNSDGDQVTLWTYVRSLLNDAVAASLAAVETDADNPPTQAASTSVDKISGANNCVGVEADGDVYDGLPSGQVNETYDILVIGGSTDGDPSTGELRVISGSGTDDVASVTPGAFGTAFAVGTRGLTATFVDSDSAGCSTSATDGGVIQDGLVAGQRWKISLRQRYTPPTPTGGGTYAGATDTTIIVEVTRGGLFSSGTLPQISVSTSTGVDLSGPTTVSSGVAVDAGTQGATISFTGNGLRKGDRFYIVATAEADGPVRTVVLGHNIDTDIVAGSAIDLTLYIKKTLLQVEQNRTGFAPLTNWTGSTTEITVADGITAYDETWTDAGVPVALDVISESGQSYGALYVEYRAWLSDLCTDVHTIDDAANIDVISGVLHPDNPLKWGVFKALENSNGVEVKYTSVCNPDDIASWTSMVSLLTGRDDVYGLVPLTRSRTVLDLLAAHVADQSTPTQDLWRVLWTNLAGLPEIPVISAGTSVPGHTAATTSDGAVALAVVEDDPNTSGTQYTVVRATSGNVSFFASGVRAGDTVRIQFVSDGFGNYAYSEYTVDEVLAEDELRLLAGPSVAVNVASKFEVWRTLTADEEADAIAAVAGAWGSRRIESVWPDTIDASGTTMEGYFLCCSLAGLASGVLPQQGLTHVQITGYTDVPRTVSKFNRAQLDRMAGSGVWIVTKDLRTGAIYSRQAVTTGDYSDLNQREEMRTRNADSVSYRFKDHFAPFIGVVNVTPTVQARLRLEADQLIEALKTESATSSLGGQLISGTITRLEPHLVFQDRYVMVVECVGPFPMNNLECHLLF